MTQRDAEDLLDAAENLVGRFDAHGDIEDLRRALLQLVAVVRSMNESAGETEGLADRVSALENQDYEDVEARNDLDLLEQKVKEFEQKADALTALAAVLRGEPENGTVGKKGEKVDE